MATQASTKPEEQQNQTSQNQPSQGTQGARGSQQGALARGSSVPVGLVTPMDLFRMNPFSLMRRMTEEMDRVFAGGGQEPESGGDVLWAPAIEVSQREGKYVVRAELPGVKPEDVRIEIENKVLVLQGERRVQREQDRGGVHRTEIRYGRFYRTIPLPEGAQADQAEAKLDNGVVEVTIPVPEETSQRKQIPIQTGSSATASAT
jgi:HSP20 family protein